MPRKTSPAYRRRIQRYSTNITSVVILCTVLGITVHASWNALVQPGEPLTASSWNAVTQEITRLGDEIAGLGTLATKSTVTSDDITDGTITNTDINASAAIATSKLSGAVTSITGHGLGSLATQSAVGNSNIADGVITFNKLATNLCTEGQVMKLNQHNQWACGEAAADLGTAAEQDVGTAAGNVVQLDGSARLPAVDGSQLTNLPSSGMPIGTVIHFAANTPPSGYLKANGAAVSRTTYATLFAVIGTTYGAGNGSTTFNLPDLRGEFLRGWDDGRGVDPGRVLGSAQADAFQGHWMGTSAGHILSTEINNANWLGGANNGGAMGVGATKYAPVSDGVHGTPRIAAETRPRNVALLACIRAY